MMYGYARVSTAAQDHAAQSDELVAAGCGHIFAEKASAAAGKARPQLVKAIAILRPGDVLVVTRLNRLARSARDALNTVHSVLQRGADFRSLREAWIDTTTPHGRLMATIYAGLAEFDREMILERTAEGTANARARGVKVGRPHALTREQMAFIAENRNSAEPMTVGELCRLMGVSASTVKRIAARGLPKAVPEPDELDPMDHARSCALFGAGNGAARRCTCGGRGRGQIDIEDLTAD